MPPVENCMYCMLFTNILEVGIIFLFFVFMDIVLNDSWSV